MLETLRFQQSSPKLVPQIISAGVPNGLALQLWIRRTGDNTRQPIIEKFDDRDQTGRVKMFTMGLAGTQIVVEVGEAIYGNVGEAEGQT